MGACHYGQGVRLGAAPGRRAPAVRAATAPDPTAPWGGPVQHLASMEAVSVGLLFGVATVFPLGGYGHVLLVAAIAGEAGTALDPRLHAGLYGWLHVAVAVGLFAYFWRDWAHVVRGVASVRAEERRGERRRAWLTLGACVPGCVGAVVLPRWMRPLADRPEWVAAILATSGLLLIGTWLWWRVSPRAAGLSGTHRAPMTRSEEAAAVSSELSHLPWRRALLVGLAPVVVAIPGPSATGLAMVFGLARTMSHEQAVRFGLVVVTPALLLYGAREMSGDPSRSVFVAAGVGAVAAYLAAALLMRYFKTATLRPFGAYCLLAGAAAAWWLTR